jgi:uncharacterized membrane protein YccC
MPSAIAERPGAWTTFWRGVAKFQKSKINTRMALRNAIGVAAPLAVGAAVGELGAGLIMSTGALQVAFRDSDAPYRERARFMLAGSVIAGVAVMLGSLSGEKPVFAVALATLWAFASGMMVALGQQAGELGLMSLVLIVIYGAVPMPPERAVLAGFAAFCGGVLQTALAVANWAFDPYAPVRRAVGDLYLAISAEIVKPVVVSEAPLATQQSMQAQSALKTLEADRSRESDRLSFLLAQAERLRLSLLALLRVRLRLERDYSCPEECAVIDSYIAEVSRLTGAIGRALKTGSDFAGSAENLDQPAEKLRERPPQTDLATMFNDARRQMDAIGGQIRTAIDVLSRGETNQVRSVPDAPQPRTRVRDYLLTLRANLSLESAACRHAVRLAGCVAVADGLARGWGVARPYWLPMTVAIVLRPDFGSTFSRGVLRLMGTFGGLLLATGLIHVLPQDVGWHIAIIAVLMFVVRSFGAANYGVFATAVTAMVIFLLWLNGVAPQPVMAARAVNTCIGGAIALIAYWVWPTWERSRVADTMAEMLLAYGAHLAALRENYASRTAESAAKLERTRVAGRLARTNFEASVERAISEPGVSAENAQRFTAMLASSRRFVQALMALEASIMTDERVQPREEFHKFADDVNRTLELLAGALRGTRVDPAQFPDLREDHHALIHSAESGGVYALVNVETDRMTNALNTLAGEVLEWMQPEAAARS